MTAYYPSSVKTFTNRVDFTDTILAEHVNSLQDEVNAIEATLGTYIKTGSGWVGSFDQVTTAWDTVKDRLVNIEYGLGDAYLRILPSGGTTGQVLRKTSSSNYAVEWAEPVTGLPSQSGNTGKYLTTDGSSASWATVAQGGETISSFLLAGC